MDELGATIDDDIDDDNVVDVGKFDSTLTLLLALITEDDDEDDKLLFDTTVFSDKVVVSSSKSGSVLQHKTVWFGVSLATDMIVVVGVGLDIVAVMDTKTDGVLVVGICSTAASVWLWPDRSSADEDDDKEEEEEDNEADGEDECECEEEDGDDNDRFV